MSTGNSISFKNTKNAFLGKTNNELRQSYWLFRAINSNWLVSITPFWVNTAFSLHLPINGIIKATIFKQFCGGETIDDCEHTINRIYKQGIGSILDYSVEGTEDEAAFDGVVEELLRNINKANGDDRIPFCVFKPSGIASNILLEKASSNAQLSESENIAWQKFKERVNQLCSLAATNNVKLFIDAEESWIQDAIDDLANEMMIMYNKDRAIVYNTAQMYRKDRLDFIKKCHQHAKDNNYILGLKLVRGAYMEKERERAAQNNYPSPIQATKEGSDTDYDLAIKYCVGNLNDIWFCAGTHNEVSCMKLLKLMYENKIKKNDERVYFSQLLGMSNHISFNLSVNGFNVTKYVPYGPVKSVMPYLLRRAKENTSISGQMGKELVILIEELKRRKKDKN
ncbi:MAG: proline dehydrogenase [Bacteroidia bacterium]|nr:proline dehydrogenase family protein [Bacteroidia bacterium]NNC85449.1 proline dehydrogenase [Bacteroidia bacterium]NNM15023.1 proline dehydrogenase [Bacteroidia bacterium]